jgi:translocation and assembly module TamB
MAKTARHRTLGKRLIRILIKSVLFFLLFILVVYLLILTPPAQRFLKNKFVSYLEKRLDTKVSIGSIHLGLPKKIIVKDFYMEDRLKDTLISAGQLEVDLAIFKLAFRNEVRITNLELSNSTVKIKRQLPDTAFNFQFVLDAFTPAPDTSTATDTTASILEINRVALNNIRGEYKDVVSGTDATFYLNEFDTRFGKLDPDNLHFEIPSTRIEGVVVNIYQAKPLTQPESTIKDKAEANESTDIFLGFKNIDLADIQLNYRNEVSATYAQISLGDLIIKMNELNLAGRHVNIEQFDMNNTIAKLRFGKKEAANIVAKEAEKEITTRVEAGWNMQVENLNLGNNAIRFDNDNAPPIDYGMDYSHLQADSLNLVVDDLIISNDSIGGLIRSASFREKSGFLLEELRTNFLYSTTTAYVNDLYLKTPGTELKRKAAIRYASLESLKNDIGNMYMDADLEDSYVQVKDILTFVPALRRSSAFNNPAATVYINSQFHGTLDAIQIDVLQVRGLHETNIDIAGNVNGLLTAKNPQANLAIRNLATSRRDVSFFIPANRMPTNIQLPDQISANGNIVTRGNGLQTNLRINSSLGLLNMKGQLSDWNSMENIRYQGTVQSNSFDAGTFLKNTNIPDNISAHVTIDGRGTNPKTMNGIIDGQVESIIFKDYNYRNIAFHANIANQKIKSTIRVCDPNIHLTAEADGSISSTQPAIAATIMIDSIKLQPLHFTRDPIIYRGKLEAQFPVAKLNALEGNLLVSQSLLVNGEKRVQLDTIQVIAGTNDSGRYVNLNSPLVNASIVGQYDLVDLPAAFVSSIQPYFRLPNVTLSKPANPYDFRLHATITNNKAWTTIIPNLGNMQPVKVDGHFSTQGWNATANAPQIEIGKQQLSFLQARAATIGDSLSVTASVEHLYINENFQLGATSLSATAANNTASFALNSRDRQQQTKYNLLGNVQYNGQDQYALILNPNDLILNYDQWTITPGNQAIISATDIHINNFLLSRNSQQLRIQSLSNERNAPLQANFTNFQLLTLTGLIQADSALADGLLNGVLTLEQLNPRPIFTSDITVNDLRIRSDTTGNLRLRVNNRTVGTYDVDATLTGRGNDLDLRGTYQPYAGANPLNLDLDIRNLNVTTIQAFSAGTIYDGSGALNGKFKVTGSIAAPSINGNLTFNKAVFGIKNLGDHFSIDGEQLRITEEGLDLDNLVIKDSVGNEMVLNGTIGTKDFTHFQYNTHLRTQNFRLLSTTKKQNKNLYGVMYVNANLEIRGNESLPVIDGRIMINEKTNMTMVLPQKEPAIVRRDGIVEFVSFNSPNDSLFLVEDSTFVEFFTGIDASITVETSKDANFTIIIDEGNGDFINIRGTTLLTAGSDRSGKLILSGTFELESGAYEISFNLLRRKFDIQKGSRITWEGEPTRATVDVTAKYIANVPPLDLVKNQLSESSTLQRNTYMQRLPFEVILHMEGSLMEPVFSFDITLPADKSYGVSQDIITNVQTRLEQLRQEEGDMNKQVFSLLLLNRFVADNPFSGMSNTFDAERFARQSVSKLLTEQLNRLAADLIAGVELRFDVESYEDYTTGEKSNRTDLNVGLSKRLLNDRLTVTVGSNFAIEGTNNTQQANNIIGDVTLDYKISRDGRYLLRTYRVNEYYGVLEGYVVETGIGFVVTIDYNRFREIFESSKRRREREQKRNANPQ